MASRNDGRREHSREREHSRPEKTSGRDSRGSKGDVRAKRRPEPEPKNGFIDSVIGFIFSIIIGISNFFKKIDKDYIKYIYIAVGIIVVFFAGLLIYWGLTNINAQTVYLDELKIGTFKIPKDGEIEASYIEEMAVNKLENDVGSKVLVSEKVTVEAVHAKDKLVELDSIAAEIAKKYTYKIEAASITVDGQEVAVVSSKAAANEILSGIKNKYYQEGLNIVKAEFVEDVQVTDVFVDKADIIPKEEASDILSANSRAEETYTIKDGDTPGKIAANAGMTLDELLALNPGVEPTKLKIGSTLTLSVSKPFLSVKTFEQITYSKVMSKTVETKYNNSLNSGEQRIIQQGRDGEQEVTAYVIRINGYEEKEREIIDTKITVAPIQEIVEVGTR